MSLSISESRGNQLSIFMEEDVCPAKIKVVGVGGGGGNAINRMIQLGIQGVEFIAVNTDLQDLRKNLAPIKLQIGATLTRGLGTGGNPELGAQAAMEDIDDIDDVLKDADMLFLAAGLGGGTGTGALPVVANRCREHNDEKLVVAVVTLPFSMEIGRDELAQKGLEELQGAVDTLIVIPNDKILEQHDDSLPLSQAFQLVDDHLRYAVQGISDLITKTGFINLDFKDVLTVLKNQGKALMGVGEGEGENCIMDAFSRAMASPLLHEDIQGAQRVLINLQTSPDQPIRNLKVVSEKIKEIVAQRTSESRVMLGVVWDNAMKEAVRITLFLTGFNHKGARVHISDPERIRFSKGKKSPLLPNPQDDYAPMGKSGHHGVEGTHLDDLDELEKPSWIRKQKKDPKKDKD